MSVARLIKRYPNRRLYDTVLKRYITLAHVTDLVLAREDFSVRDSADESDVTPYILLQALVAGQSAGKLRIEPRLLARVIRSTQR